MSSAWQSIITDATNIRHTIHSHPELTWQERHTAQFIRQQLDELGISWRECAKYGTVATLASEAQGPHIGLRADIDALPIDEAVDLPYRSQQSGCMHACGHDGHTAALWATAAWLKSCEDKLPGPVSLLFQPAEEGGHGAKKMIEDGALRGIDKIYGWHNWPMIPYGQAACPDGPVMAGNGTFHIHITGKGGHASQPEVCRDPVLAAAAITMNMQQIVSRRLAPQSAAVVSVSSIEAPSEPTVTPEKAKVEGSIRISDPTLRHQINQLITEITEQTAATYGVKAEVEIRPRYEATINHPEPAQCFRDALKAEFGDDWFMSTLPLPIMASEDFSYYLDEIPGAYALIGMADNGRFTHACHSPHYEFNDELLAPVVRVFSHLVGAPMPPK